MKARNLLLTGLLGGTILALGCKDDPLVPPTRGSLRIVVTFDTTAIGVTVAAGPGATPNSVSPPDGGPRFDFSAITGGEVWILQNGSTVQNFTLTLQGSELRGTSGELDAGRYQIVVAGVDGGFVTYYGEGAATVVAGQDSEAHVNLQNFTPVAIVAANTVSTEALVRWSLAGGASRDEFFVEFANNPGFAGSRNLRAPVTQTTTTFPVDAPGTYYTRVRAENQYVSTRGVFSAVASTEVLQDTLPSGNDPATAPVMGFAASIGGTTYAGLNVLPAGDVDWFAFNACALDLVSVTLRTGTLNPASGLDAALQLFNADGTALLGEDSRAGQGDKVVSVTLPGTGTYNMTVAARTSTNAVGEYQLQIQVTPGAITDTANERCIFQADPIVFVSDEDGDREIFLRNADGSQVSQLTANTDVDILPLWSPDGSRVLFSRFSFGTGNWDAWVMNADGTNQVNLTASPGRDDFGNAWHPDGSRIALRSSATGGAHDVWVMAADGSGMFNFTNDPGTNQAGPWFTPDGSRMVYSSDEDGDLELFIIDVDGANRQQLTSNSGFEDNQPRVSPDGSRIAFYSNRGGSQSVWVMGIDGSNQVDLTGTLGGGASVEFVGGWSPDGTRLIVGTNAFGSDSADSDVVVINADGSGSPIPIAQAPGFQGFGDWRNPRSVASDLMTVATAYPDTVFLHATDVTGENRFALRVDNAGDVAYLAGGNLTVDLWVNDEPSFSVVSGAQLMASPAAPNMVPAGESRLLPDFLMPAVLDLSGQYLDPGQLYFMAEVDPSGVIAESDETNNSVTFSALGANWVPTTVGGMLYHESVATDGGGPDTLDLYVSEDAVSRGLLVSAIPDFGSTVDPILDLRNAAGAFGGGSQNNYTGTVTATAVAELGNGRSLHNGELMALPVIPAGGALRTSIAIRAHLTGDYQLSVQRCELFDMGTAAAGGHVAGALAGTDCVMWPNPISGAVTYARMYTFTAADGDEVRIDLTSTDIDPTLWLFDPGGLQWSFDDDGGGSGNSRLLETLTAGTWTIVASAFGEFATGSFDLTVSPVVNTVTPIVFSGSNGGMTDIFVRSPDGLTFTNLTNDAAADAGPVWSPDGSQIVFYSSDRDNASNDIYVMDADGSNIINVTNNPGSSDARPGWSPDGTRIAFRSDRDGNGEIYVMNADGTALWNFSNVPASDETGPVFSPDGSRLLYYTNADGDWEIVVQDLDGGGRTQLTTNDGSDIRARFSPDGSMIAWTSDLDIWVMNSDGTNPVNLTGPQFAGTIEINPTWSADGSMLAFRGDLENPGGAFYNIYTMNLDGTNVRRVSDGVTNSSFPNWQKIRDVSVDLSVAIVAQHDTVLIDPGEVAVIPVSMEAQVSNNGAVAAHLPGGGGATWTVSHNAAFGDGDDEGALTQGVPELIRAGDSYSFPPFDLDPNVLTDIEYGRNYLRIVVDADGVIAESDETNNSAQTSLQFGRWLRDGDTARRFYVGTTGDPLDDPGDLIVDEASVAAGLLVSAIPNDAGLNPALDLTNVAGSFGGDQDGYNGVTTATTVPDLGNGRNISGGEIVALPVEPDGGLGFTRTAVVVSGANGTQGSYQLNVQRCQLVHLGAGASTVGVSASDSLRNTDCTMWPNPISGGVTYARMYTFEGTVGDELVLDLTSTDVDATLFLFPPSGNGFLQDDDGGDGANSRIGVTLDETGRWVVVASTWVEMVQGAFTLGIQPNVNTVTPIAFAGRGSGDWEIYVRSADGLTVTNLTNDPADDAAPEWSPDRTRIAFHSNRDGDREVFVMNADGSGVTNLSNSPGSEDGLPTWSPDGSRIAFQSDRDGNPEIYVMNADGSNQWAFTSTPANEYSPRFSPDGGRLIYAREDGGGWGIITRDLDGANETQLTQTAGQEGAPVYSPDGSTIAWYSHTGGGRNIWLMNADGSNARNLTATEICCGAGRPTWSPDGSMIAFVGFHSAPDTSSIYIITVDGSNLRRLIGPGVVDADVKVDWQKPRNLSVDLATTIVSAHATVLVGDAGEWTAVGPLMEATVSNLGTVAAHHPSGQIDVDWIISPNTVFGDGDDQVVNWGITNLLLPGESDTGGSFFLDPTGLSTADLFGTNYVRAIADPQNVIAESDESNNSDDTTVDFALWLQDADVARRLHIGTTGAPLGDVGDWIVDEVSLATGTVGLLISVIPDIGSGIDPGFDWWSGESFDGSHGDQIQNVTTNTSVSELGTGRVIVGGEIAAFTVEPDASKGFTRTSIRVVGDDNTQGGYQANVQRCALVDLGDVSALGASVTDSIRSNDCVTWPNPFSGSVTYARMYSFNPTVGEVYVVDLLSTDFDATVLTFAPRGFLFGPNDDGGDGDNARMAVPIIEPGTWTIVVSSYEETVEGQFQLVVSPVFNTGTDVAFTGVDANGQRDIYRRSGDGLTFTNLTNSASLDQWPVWSPDGTRVAFQSDRDNGSSDVYVMNADGSNVVNLTNNPGSSDGRPNWSPDGNRIAFTSDRDGNREVYLVNADGSGLFNLSSSPGVDETGPVISPDGSQLLYYSNGDGDWEVVTLNLDGSGVTQLTNNSSGDIRPRYSPDGSRIAWASNEDGSYDIWVMNSDGSNPVNVTGSQFPGAMELNPAWSPDGTQLVFTSDLLDPGNPFTNLYVVNADGSGVRRISNGYTDSFHPNWQNPVNVAADLAITSVTAHDTLFVGDGGGWMVVGPLMEAEITNNGQVAAFAPSPIDVSWTVSSNGVFGDADDETPWAWGLANLIRPGESVSTGQFNFGPNSLTTIDYGINEVRVMVDRPDEVPESNEANNSSVFQMPIALWLRDGDVARRFQAGTNGGVYDDIGNDLFVDDVHQDAGLLISLIEDIGSSDNPLLRVAGASFGFAERDNNDISGIVTITGVPELGNGRSINGGELAGFPVLGGSVQGERIAVEVAGDVAYQVRIERCDLAQIAIGDSVGGTLAVGNCKTWPNLLSGSVTYGVMFSFDAQVGDQLVATAGSGVFDPVVIVFGPEGDLADASGAPAQATAAVTGTVTDAGTHIVLVTTWGEMATGDFWLTLTRVGGGALRAMSR